MKRFRFRLEVGIGQLIPKWHGLAYQRRDKPVCVCYPMPVNLIVRWSRKFWWLMKRNKPDALSGAYSAGHRDGFQDGKRFAQSQRAAEDRETRVMLDKMSPGWRDYFN